MIAPIIALATVALATSTAGDKPYIMQEASDLMVKYAIKYRQTDVSEDKASSAAAEIIDSVFAQPKATALVKSAVSYLAQSGPSVNGAIALEAATKASSFYDEIATKPAYTDFATAVAEKTPFFDLSRALNDAQAKLNNVSQKNSRRIGNGLVKANAIYRSVAAESNGAEAIETGKQLASRVAKDFKIDTTNVKSKANTVKTNFLSKLFSY